MSDSGQNGSSASGDIPHNAGKKKQQQQDVEEEDEDSDIGEDEYVVEAIVGHKFVNKRVIYEVAWVGYEEHSWEPKANLDGCPDKLQAYWDEIDGEPKPSKNKAGRPPRQDSDGPSKRRKLSPSESATPKPSRRGRGAQKGAGASKEPKPGQFEASNGKWYSLPAGTWDNSVVRIDSVWMQGGNTKKQVLMAKALFDKEFDHQMFSFRSIVLHSKAPRRLLEFYEQNLQFQDASVPGVKPVNSSSPSEHMDMDGADDEDNGNISDVEDDDDDALGIKDVARA